MQLITILSLLIYSFSVYANAASIQADTLSPHPAQRVITLSPHATELAYSAGLGDKLIAVSEASNYPPEAQKIETIANYQGIKLERILALRPDLIIAWSKSSYSREMQQIINFGIPVVYVPTQRLDDIPKDILRLSLWAEEPSIGKKNANKFNQALLNLRTKYQTSKPIRYFLQLSSKPIISVSSPHWPSDIFTLCGGRNIINNTATPYPQMGLEQLITAKPQAIFTTSKQTLETAQWRDWPQIPAVKNQFIWSLNPDLLSRPTVRSLQVIDQVCQAFEQVRQHESN